MPAHAGKDSSYLHLGKTGVYTRELFRFLHDRGGAASHVMLARGVDSETVVGEEPYAGWVRHESNPLRFIDAARRLGSDADGVIIHGLFDPAIDALMLTTPHVRRKSVWIIWGRDLYAYVDPIASIKHRLYRGIRRLVVRSLPRAATHIPGDVTVARSALGFRGAYLEVMTYPNTSVDDSQPDAYASPAVDEDPIHVLAGNSASRTNRHEELLLRLADGDDGSMRISCPLSYGDPAVRKQTIVMGHELFGARFVPLTRTMPVDEYSRFLRTVDVAVFNHRSQEGVGNILELIALGKRVFIHRSTTTWAHLEAMGIVTSDVDDLSITRLQPPVASSNAEAVYLKYGRSRLPGDLSALFGWLTGDDPNSRKTTLHRR